MIVGAMHRPDGSRVVARVMRTTNPWDRLRGLLGRSPLQFGEGLLITPCASVHTLGMGYPLDLVFLDADGRIRKLVNSLAPLRMAACPGAAMTLELAGGALRQMNVQVGEVLTWRGA